MLKRKKKKKKAPICSRRRSHQPTSDIRKRDAGEREEEFKAPRHDVLILHRIIREGFEKNIVLMREKIYPFDKLHP